VFEFQTVILNETTTSFYRLDPDLVLAATEEAGFQPTGEFTQLNSYENRVFDIRLEKNSSEYERVIAKFYRPGRWPREALLEEHEFLFDLEREGVPVVAPLMQKNKSSLCEVEGMFVTFFPKFLGRMPEEFLEKDLYQVGHRLAQIHNVGSRRDFKHRAVLGEAPYSSWDNLELLSRWVAPEVWARYEQAAISIIETFENHLNPAEFLRIHGDCHRGNLLARLLPGNQREFFFVDFDDCAMGPEVQDFWMLFSGSDLEDEQDLILSGYEELREFPVEQWKWIPLLRGLRIFSYSAWIARRWKDPSFPRLFPDFESFTFWAEETEALEKIAWSLDRL
jgi:Ser/Thr protein kinase RdoA (MazF antagonist)